MPPPGYLDRIVAAHRARAESDRRDPEALLARAEDQGPTRGFSDHIADSTALAVVAEIKRRSPSKGDIDLALDPADVARRYAEGGATCLSVLTDEEHFGGSPADLVSAREACEVPVLRKDFTVSVADVCDARSMGADALLLIAAVLSDDELSALHTLAIELSMDPLVEVHDERELDRALELGAALIGVNQRDLTTFEVDTSRAARLAGLIPPEVVAVAESGIGSPEDAHALAEVGYQAVLVGESLLRAPDRAGAVSAMCGFEIGHREASGVPGRVRG
ncbi:MAG TPA: indole-3-glycerol phosphate synthase TrpC [Acidimicrobiales bacterium]|nr:indole-3-glycerol phosphate synthase TrpC [Acidimicrobiales bacterium]